MILFFNNHSFSVLGKHVIQGARSRKHLAFRTFEHRLLGDVGGKANVQKGRCLRVLAPAAIHSWSVCKTTVLRCPDAIRALADNRARATPTGGATDGVRRTARRQISEAMRSLPAKPRVLYCAPATVALTIYG